MNTAQLQGWVFDTLRAVLWLAIIAAIFLPLEALFPAHRGASARRFTVHDLAFYVISAFVPQMLLALPLFTALYLAYYLVPAGVHASIETWPIWLRGLAAFVVADFGFYWGHRVMHASPLLWRFHAVHHAPSHVYFLTSSRAHPVDNAIIRLFGLVPIYLLGLGAPQSVQGTLVATLLMLAITVWGFFIHANLRWRLGPIEWLVATPAFHRWHHSLDGPRDRNFASMLPCWDWMFGTHHLPRKSLPSAYGIDEPLPNTILGQLGYPLRPVGTPSVAPSPAGIAEPS